MCYNIGEAKPLTPTEKSLHFNLSKPRILYFVITALAFYIRHYGCRDISHQDTVHGTD